MWASSPTRAAGGAVFRAGCVSQIVKKQQGALNLTLLFQCPFLWVIVNIFPFFVIICLIPDDMVIIGPLKNGCADFFRRQGLNGPDNACDPAACRFLGFEGNALGYIQPDNQMGMVRHDDVFFNLTAGSINR